MSECETKPTMVLMKRWSPTQVVLPLERKVEVASWHVEHNRKTNGPRKVDGSPDLRYKANERPGTAVYDSRHRNPHAGGPPPQRRRHDRPWAKKATR